MVAARVGLLPKMSGMISLETLKLQSNQVDPNLSYSRRKRVEGSPRDGDLGSVRDGLSIY